MNDYKLNIVLFAIPFFAVSVLVEGIYNYYKKYDYYEPKDAVASLSMGIGNAIIRQFTPWAYLPIYFLLYENRIFDFGTTVANIFTREQLPIWILIIFADDFIYYWFHRASHKCRYLWASHVIHHSSKKYNLTTALRQTWTGKIITPLIFWSWMPIIGFNPIMIVTMKSINLIYQFWIHTEIINKMPKFFEVVFNTPSHHRVHHGTDIIYVDKNYAGIFIIWDKMFGTFQMEVQRPTYGLIHNIDTYNPLKIATHEWFGILKDMKFKNTLFNNIKYIFEPPGWSHDDSRQTIEQIREKSTNS